MNLFASLAVVLGIAAVGAVMAKLLRQPAIMGYLIAGGIVSIMGLFGKSAERELLSSMGEIGVTLLLFLVGLELPTDELKHLGKTAVITGVVQMLFTSLIGFGVASILGFALVPAMFLGLALSFGSTVLVINLLSQKKDLQSLYGRISVGFLLMQDFVAIGVLVALSGLSGGIFLTLVKGIGLLVLSVWLSGRIIPKVLDWFGNSTEILFITSLGWCLAVAAVVSSPMVGFSPEIGGFLAGLTLANAAQNLQIVSRIKPLRDFFMTLFFVSLGAGIDLSQLSLLWPLVLILAGVVLVVNPVVIMIILGVLGYSRRIGFFVGITVAQVSEFALIIMALAVNLGYISPVVLSLVAMVSIFTMLISAYNITFSEALYQKIGKRFLFKSNNRHGVLEKKDQQKFVQNDQVVLFGHNRIGKIVRPALEKLGRPILVVDFDPRVLSELEDLKVNSVYGDISDIELYEDLGLKSSSLVVSTVTDVNDNLQLLEYLKEKDDDKSPLVILSASDYPESSKLYDAGADYVLVPHTLGGEFLSNVFETRGIDKGYFRKLALAFK
jgi:Kef-type K+ transport system membrane component KefB/voltage-gated potassium channel Kch